MSNLLFSIIPLLSAIHLDQMMTPNEQKVTGVRTLTSAQKAALEQWIDQHFITKEQEMPQLYLSVNLDNGRRLELSDGSVYEIAPQDVIRTSSWITPFPITIESSDDLNYPLKLVNVNTGQSVKARKLESLSP